MARLAVLLALVVVVMCALAPAALAAKKPSGPPEFLALPFSFSGSGNDAATNLPQNELLAFMNGTAGASGMIQVTVQTTSGSVSLQACPVEICFRGTATLSGRKPLVASPALVSAGATLTLVAAGEESDAVPWWFWLSNAQPQAAASGTLTVTLVPTVVVNSTSDSVDLSVGGGELRLIKVEAQADAGLALRVGYTETTAAGTFQFFAPSDTVLPSNTSLLLANNSYISFANLFVIGKTPQGTFAPPPPELSGSYYLAGNQGTDNATWWVVAGSRNQQAANATLTFKRVPTQPLTSNTARNFTLTELGEIQIARLPASAGRSGQIRALGNFEPTQYNVTFTAGLAVDTTEFSLGSFARPLSGANVTANAFAGLVNEELAGALACSWDDNTDWWFVIRSSADWNATADDVQLSATYIDTLLAAADGVTFSVSPVDEDTPYRLLQVPGVAGLAGIHLTSEDINAGEVGINAPSMLVSGGGICNVTFGGATGTNVFRAATLNGELSLDVAYLAMWEGQTWWIVIDLSSAPTDTRTLVVDPITVQTVTLETASGSSLTVSPSVTMLQPASSSKFQLDVQVIRIEAPVNASAADFAGLDVTYTVARADATLFPGQPDYATSTAVPVYAEPILSVYASPDLVGVFVASSSSSGAAAMPDISVNYACGGQCLGALADSATVPQIATSGRRWNDQVFLTTSSPLLAANATAAERRLAAKQYLVTLSAGGSLFSAGYGLPPINLFQSQLGRRVADDAATKVWYVTLVADISAPLAAGVGSSDVNGFVGGTNFSIPLALQVARAPIATLTSGLPVLSPPAPQSVDLADPSVPGYWAELYRLPGAAGASGLASVTVAGGGCDLAAILVSPGGRFVLNNGTLTGDQYAYNLFAAYGVTDDMLSDPSGIGFGSCLGLLSASSSKGSSVPFPLGGSLDYSYLDIPGIAGVRELQIYREDTVIGWLQAADQSDGVDWYVTLPTRVNQDAVCSFTVTLHDTINLLDDATDEFGALRWTAQGVPVSPLTQMLFKLPGRLASRGLITAVDVLGSDSGQSLDVFTGPLALTMQAQSVPASRPGALIASLGVFAGGLLGSSSSYDANTTAGSLFSLPFPTLSVPVFGFETITIGGGVYQASATGLNDDRSDIFFLGVARGNFSTLPTTVVDLVVTVGQTRVLCNDKVTCNNKGKCLSDGSCNCDSGYGGQFCTCKDSRDCSGHGVCGLTQGCVCDSGYSGADCSKSGAAALVASAALVLLFAIVAAFF